MLKTILAKVRRVFGGRKRPVHSAVLMEQEDLVRKKMAMLGHGYDRPAQADRKA